jgi:NAD-dependent dihydropyrimidine dehydrogenase PreA subunit
MGRTARKPKYSVAKRHAWDAFSKYIRLRDELKGCFTCIVNKPWKEMQAGHFLPGRHNSLLFDERNCHSQCYRCNVPLKGNMVEYYPKMLRLYGQEVIDELKVLDKQIVKLKVWQLIEIKEEYQQKFKELQDGKTRIENTREG